MMTFHEMTCVRDSIAWIRRQCAMPSPIGPTAQYMRWLINNTPGDGASRLPRV